MERRVVLAIILMIAVIVLTNILFPPAAPPPPQAGRDTAGAAPAETAARRGTVRTRAEEEAEPREVPAAREGVAERPEEEEEPVQALVRGAPPEDTIRVRTPLYELELTRRGAAVFGARLRRYASFAPEDSAGARVRLVRPGERFLGYRIAVREDTLDLRGRRFEASASELTLEAGAGSDSVVFRHRIPTRDPELELSFRLTYRFRPDSYVVDVEGSFEGLGGGYTLLVDLGRGLRSNEANPGDDYGQLAYAVRTRGDEIHSRKLEEVERGEVEHPEGGPFRWAAVRNKYFVAALVVPETGPGLGGMIVRGAEDEEHAAEMAVSLPVPSGSPGFGFGAYLGPQEYDRLSAVGQGFRNVNPVGYDWLQFIIRPLVRLIMAILTWLHETLGLAYGWVLVVFGVLMRVVLFPLYQKSMRAQMAQMELQPRIKELQEKYEDDPQKLQQAMVRLYKDEGVNPLAGCLPMLLPFPVLITLFFVFQNTIEVRGVPFLYLPDLSLKDPFYILPLVMGLSMFLIQWIGQRGMERSTQMKIMGYAMPVVMTVVFANFPAGLNLYYATSNLASLPQQYYLSRERRRLKGARTADDEGG